MAAREAEPVEPRNAASVVLLRSGSPEATVTPGSQGRLELYFLHRHARMSFAAGVAVFPGGGVDLRDHVPPERWVGPDVEEWSHRLGVPPTLAAALITAAVRETFEETGVLLAGTRSGGLVADTTGADWELDRQSLIAGEAGLSEVLLRRDLVLDSLLLTPWACWVTPSGSPRRYRTWFFLAEVPPGQEARDVSTESEGAGWWSVRRALSSTHRGDLALWPPQYATCALLFDVATPAEAMTLAHDRAEAGEFPPARFTGDEEHLGGEDRLTELAESMRSRLERT
jgi:8-oxo-dGTP pyrophosphatase MutT (NUDIX family)